MTDPTQLHGHFILLRAGALRLLLPQAGVGAADYRDCEPAPSAQPGVYTVAGAAGERQVIFPSDRLRPIRGVPPARFVLTQLEAPGAEAFWFAWDEVRVFINARVETHPLPFALCMAEDAPAQRYAEVDEQVVLCADAAKVAAYLCEGVEACA